MTFLRRILTTFWCLCLAGVVVFFASFLRLPSGTDTDLFQEIRSNPVFAAIIVNYLLGLSLAIAYIFRPQWLIWFLVWMVTSFLVVGAVSPEALRVLLIAIPTYLLCRWHLLATRLKPEPSLEF